MLNLQTPAKDVPMLEPAYLAYPFPTSSNCSFGSDIEDHLYKYMSDINSRFMCINGLCRVQNRQNTSIPVDLDVLGGSKATLVEVA